MRMKLRKYYESKNYIINLINEESLKVDKSQIYENNINEKIIEIF